MNGFLKNLAFAVAVAGSASCATANFKSNALYRASIELRCPADELVIQHVPHDDSGALRVSGCGRQAIFVYSLNGNWANDSGVMPIPREGSAGDCGERVTRGSAAQVATSSHRDELRRNPSSIIAPSPGDPSVGCDAGAVLVCRQARERRLAV